MSKNYKNFTIHHFENLESTNLTAFEMVKSKNCCENEIILANSQKAGKGRKNRIWQSEKGNLYFSLILQPKTALANISQISFVSSKLEDSVVETV